MPLIRHWFPSDEELNGALASVVQEDSADWWAGAVQCFASVAIAASLAGSALGAQLPYATSWQQDQTPALDLREGDWLPPVLSIGKPAAAAFSEQDEYVAAIAVDETGQWAVRVTASPSVVTAFMADDDFAPVAFGLDDRHYSPLVPAPAVARVAAFTGDDLFVPSLAPVAIVAAYDGTISSAPQFDGMISIAAQYSGDVTVYPA
jgi:hypothetical protein